MGPLWWQRSSKQPAWCRSLGEGLVLWLILFRTSDLELGDVPAFEYKCIRGGHGLVVTFTTLCITVSGQGLLF